MYSKVVKESSENWLSLKPDSLVPINSMHHTQKAEKIVHQILTQHCYTNLIHFLENTCALLYAENHTIVETHSKEKSTILTMFETKLTEARKILNDTMIEKSRMEMDIERLFEENTQLRNRFHKVNEQLNAFKLYEQRYNDTALLLKSTIAEKDKAINDNAEIQNDFTKLKNSFNELCKCLTNENMTSVDTENAAQTPSQTLEFARKLNIQVKKCLTMEIGEMDERPLQLYNTGLEASLSKEHKSKMHTNRNDIDTFYKANHFQIETNRTNGVSNDIQTIQNQVQVNAKIAQLEREKHGHFERIHELEDLYDKQMRLRVDDQAEIHRLRGKIAQQLQDYQDLLDIKISLDTEISAYNVMLTTEEQRLNLLGLSCERTKLSGYSSEIKATPRKRKCISFDQTN
ncbi:lamin-C-like [Contarinia nasturtii]|uniref:lamin-C-like n=1 Tax=Contarinia nasturtii TaxID=265458 RepID=UPI0012D3E0DC|nr:lamin-C-like [Contarinia nasturtii]